MNGQYLNQWAWLCSTKPDGYWKWNFISFSCIPKPYSYFCFQSFKNVKTILGRGPVCCRMPSAPGVLKPAVLSGVLFCPHSPWGASVADLQKPLLLKTTALQLTLWLLTKDRSVFKWSNEWFHKRLAQATLFSVVWHLPGKGATEEKLTKVNAAGSQHQNRSFLVSDISQPKKRISTGGILVLLEIR